MALKHFNPTSPSRRGLVLVDKSELHKGRPEKSLVQGLTKSGGRGGGGRIAVRFRGGGAKRLYRIIDFKRRKWGVVGKVERLEYDPNRSAFIALIQYADGEKAYILAPQRLRIGDEIIARQYPPAVLGTTEIQMFVAYAGVDIGDHDAVAARGRIPRPLRRSPTGRTAPSSSGPELS